MVEADVFTARDDSQPESNEATFAMEAYPVSCSPMHAGYDKIGQVARKACKVALTGGITTLGCAFLGKKLGCISSAEAKKWELGGLIATGIGATPTVYRHCEEWTEVILDDAFNRVRDVIKNSKVQVSGVDVLEDECREATERFRMTRATIDKIEKEQKAQIEALCEALNAIAMAKEPVYEPPAEPASDSPAENAES